MTTKLLTEAEALDLRKRSDRLLEACGWKKDHWNLWYDPKGVDCGDARPHPYKNIDNAVRVAEAMGLRVVETGYNTAKRKYAALLHRISDDEKPENRPYWQGPHMPTIAEAISAAILEAVKGRTEE